MLHFDGPDQRLKFVKIKYLARTSRLKLTEPYRVLILLVQLLESGFIVPVEKDGLQAPCYPMLRLLVRNTTESKSLLFVRNLCVPAVTTERALACGAEEEFDV